VTALTINRLSQRDIDAMIDHLLGNKGLPASIRQDIIDRTDGIPLFVEEMTKAVLESEGEDEARRSRPSHHALRDILGGELSLARPRRGGAVPSLGRTSASQKLWRKLSRGGNR
jgi:hypothetical protein